MRPAIKLLITATLLTCTAAFGTPSLTSSAPADPPPAPVRFGWPMAGAPQVTRPFEAPDHAYGPGHRGVDLVGDVGQAVLAAGPGLVLYAGPLANRNLVSIEHPGGLRTTYEPVTPTVAVGQQVVRGQQIGTLDAGHPECTASPPNTCLHWGARRRTVYLDPLTLLGLGHVRLLPWDASPQ
ncbi:peptidase M23-like protein [Saccharopolyspora erythraea NRRL 2338]|uniref:Peptidase n=2 Tax=Saccharopolyspora erythraea TaxID=1836 RepID=A4FMD8_SACEN|nr:M23 family metallopeptidase [Saccharopolyspora erythraea]EQD87786.1 peptidase [Saccharopolyspora erythraea D]PFG98860.1 peptidase M23-like protein [Saccharopolyspora erythraea NRRL 2338]QRK88852.1 M23 family metallopeptidase [Saccharopolyspora erythraea]CAM05213.1 putative peptidase [Saccharopolyspora erythraea NRRL 2338]